MILSPKPFLFVVALFLLLVPASDVLAQTGLMGATGGAEEEGTTEAPADSERIEQLIDTLQDDEARAELIEQLRLLTEAQGQASDEGSGQGQEAADPVEVIDSVGSGIVSVFAREISNTRDRLADILRSLSDVPDFWAWLMSELQRADVRSAILVGAAWLAATLGAGLVAAGIVRRLTGGLWPHRDGDEGREIGAVILRAMGRIVLALLTLAVFAAVSNAMLVFVSDGSAVQEIAVGLILAAAVQRVAIFIIGELIRPRYVRLAKEDCLVISRSLQRIATVAIFGYWLATSVRLLGLPDELGGVVSNALGLIVLVLALRLIFTTGDKISTALSKATGPLSLLARVLAPIWILLASLYALTLFLIWSLGVDRFSEFALASLGSVVVIAAALILDALIHRTKSVHVHGSGTKAEGSGGEGEGQEDQPQQAQLVANSAWERARWPSRLAIAVAAVLLVAQFWGLDVLGWAQGEQGQSLIGTMINIALVCIVALVIWDVLRRGIESWLSSDDDGASAKRTQRMRTLLPLIRTTLGFVLGTVVLLAVLAELGINIAPLLAGAGVVGLAIGFGSQALVRDVISGAFILAENTLSVGDVVKLGSHSGLVEGLTIRSVRLRDLSGTVHTIPLGEITAVENMTKDFSFYPLNIGISYGDDVDRVIEVVREVGEDLRQDPELGWDILEPLEVLGVDEFAASAVIIKARIKTLPLRQWAVGREFNRRMKKRFDKEGINIPFPQVTVSYLDKQGGAQAMEQLAAQGAGNWTPPASGTPTPESIDDKGDIVDADENGGDADGEESRS